MQFFVLDPPANITNSGVRIWGATTAPATDPYGVMVDYGAGGEAAVRPPQQRYLFTTAAPYEPLRNNRFLLGFPEQFQIPEYVFRSCTRPSYMLNRGWEDIVLEMYDPITPSLSQILLPFMEYCRDNRLQDNTPFDAAPLFTFIINLLDPVGAIVSQWFISVKNLEQLTWSPLEYNDENLSTIMMRLSVLRCELLY